MSQDVTQWLAEIRTLQRQLADVRQERDQAYASAANWRRLYETEARQRRTEVADFQTQLKALKANNPIHRSTDPIDQSPSNPSSARGGSANLQRLGPKAGDRKSRSQSNSPHSHHSFRRYL